MFVQQFAFYEVLKLGTWLPVFRIRFSIVGLIKTSRWQNLVIR
jgi:hypothetical protein